MNIAVIWSPDARQEYAEILHFLHSEYGPNSTLKMLEKVESTIEYIASYPRAFPFSHLRPDIRKAVITPQTSLLYRITEHEIQLLHFWDNRQDSRRMELL